MRYVEYNGQVFYPVEDILMELMVKDYTSESFEIIKKDNPNIDWEELTLQLPMPKTKEVVECVDSDGMKLLKELTYSWYSSFQNGR